MVSDHQRPAVVRVDVPRELSAVQFARVQFAQLPRIRPPDQLCDPEEVRGGPGAR